MPQLLSDWGAQLQAQRPQLTLRQWALCVGWLLVGAAELWWRQSALVWMLGLVAVSVWLYRHALRHPHAWLQRAELLTFTGCHVDVAAQRVSRYCMELRHVRSGPVVVLCELVSHTPLSAADVASIDEAVDVMAQRLGIRRTGKGLLPPASRGASAAVRTNQH